VSEQDVEGVAEDGDRLRPEPAWAHRSGLVSLVPPGAAPQPPDVHRQLQNVISRYCWGFDERRADVLEACFTADAVWAASVMAETRVGPFTGRPAVMKWLTDFWPHQRDQRRHLILNFLVEELDGDSATGLAYLLLMGSSDAATRMESCGLYRLRYRRDDDGEWRIASLLAGFDSPYWKQEVHLMKPWVKELFGITEEPRPTSPA